MELASLAEAGWRAALQNLQVRGPKVVGPDGAPCCGLGSDPALEKPGEGAHPVLSAGGNGSPGQAKETGREGGEQC